MSVVIAGGGTGGHIEPALALADALRRGRSGDRDHLPGHRARPGDPAGPGPRLRPGADPAGAAAAVADPAAALGAGPDARLGERRGGDPRPDARATCWSGFGGYVATPGYLAAWRRGVPIVVHEANSRPGLANRIGARLTPRVFTGQPGVKMAHSRYIGIPIRRRDRRAGPARARRRGPGALRAAARPARAAGHRRLAGRPDDQPGGPGRRAGAARGRHPGAAHRRAAGGRCARPRAGDVPYIVLPYLDRMDLGYAAADFALCRGGAMTCAEMTAVGLPAAYVPLPHGNGEQRLNALPIEQAGGGLIVADADLTPEWIIGTLLPVLMDAELLAAMSKAAAGSGHRDADRLLAEEVLDLASRSDRGTVSAGHRRSAGSRRGASMRSAARTGIDGARRVMGLVTPVGRGAAQRAGPGALHRHRRRGDVRHRPDHAGRGRDRLRQRLGGLGPAGRAGRARGPGRRRARRGEPGRRGHARGVHARSGRTTPS